MPATRKSYDIKGIGGSGGRFSVGTLVQNHYGAPGIIIRIVPPARREDGKDWLRAWVAYDISAHTRTMRQYRTPDAFSRMMQESAGRCEVRLETLYMLKPVGQAKRLPKCNVSGVPGYQRPVRGTWVRASKPVKVHRKTPREKQAEIHARLEEYDRQARSSRHGFPNYKPSKFVSAASVIESYERYVHWERKAAEAKRKYAAESPHASLRKKYRLEAAASERRVARAERIIARLRARSS